MVARKAFLVWTFLALALGFALRSARAAEAPANDLIENARVIPGAVGSVTNLTNVGATVSMGDPETSGVLANIWFRQAPLSISSTGRVSLSGGNVGGRTLRVYEQTDAGLVRRAMNTSAVMVTNAPGKTNFIAIYYTTGLGITNALNYSFATLQLAAPAPGAAFSTGEAIGIDARNPELDFEAATVTARARNGELGWAEVLSGASFPLAGDWTSEVAGTIDFYVEAATASGELRRSGTNQVTVLAANDAFANATELEGVGGELLIRPFRLTREVGEPTASTLGSMWFRWTPAASGVARISAGPTQPLALYRGTAVGSLTQVAALPAVAGLDGLQAEVTAGQTYYLAAYEANASARRLTYSVAPIRFTSPMARTGLKAPLAIDFAVSGTPADVEAVDYYRGGVWIGRASAAPFGFRWETVLTGPMVITAVGRGAGGASYESEAIGLQVSAVNDNFADATVLPPNVPRMDIYASGYLAAHGEFETGAGIWYRWTPVAGGFCSIIPVEQGVGILVLSGGARVAEAYNRAVSFQSEAGRTYSILLTHSVAPENGFHVSIHNSPIVPTDANGWQGQPMELRPAINGATTGIARVDYTVGEEIVASGTGPGFVGIWTPPLTGAHFFRVTVVYEDGVRVDGGWATARVAPGNDMFANAATLAGDVTRHELSVDSTWATTEAGESAAVAKTVWWKWTPAFDGRVRIKIVSDGWQHSVVVGTGETLGGLAVVSQNYSVAEGLTFTAVAGTTYHIGVGGNFSLLMWTLTQETLAPVLLSSATSPIRLGVRNTNPNDVFTSVDFYANGQLAGRAAAPNFELVWNELGTTTFEVVGTNQLDQVRRSLPLVVPIVPSNDHFVNALIVPSGTTNFTARGSFLNATIEENELFQYDYASVWWRWTPTFSGRVTLRGTAANGAGFDAQVATGESLATLVEVARIYAGGDMADFRVEAGVTYHISMRSAPWVAWIDFTLEEETFELLVPMRRLPIDLVVANTNPGEVFEAVTILLDGAPLATVTGPEWSYRWTEATPGRHVLSARGVNQLGETRLTRAVEYWVGPANDYFADVAEMNLEGVTAGNLGNASMEPGEVKWYAEELGTVWYRFTAQRSGYHTFMFDAGGANIHGRTGIYRGTELRNLQAMGRIFGANTVIVPLEAGVSYFVVVTTTDRRDEAFAFRVAQPPVNDHLANAIELVGNTPSFSGNTTSASREFEENEMLRNNSEHGSIWFRWTPTVTGNASFFADASPGTLLIMVVSGSSWADAVAHYPYTSLIGWANGLPMRVVAGTTYHFALYAPPGAVAGHITMLPIAAPPNDFRRDATLLSGNSVRVTGEFVNSTFEVGERTAVGNGIGFGGTIWYRWVAPSVGRLRYWLDNGVGYWERGYHVLMDNDGLNGITEVSQGQIVYLQVSCPDNDLRPATLNLEFEPGTPVANDAFASAAPVAEFPFQYEGDIFWATREAGEPRGQYLDGGPRSAWFAIRANEIGVVSASTGSVGPYWNVRLVIYRGTALGSLEYIGETTSGTFSFVAAPGGEYRLQVQDTQNGGFPGRYALAVRFAPRPANDMFADRIALSGNNHSIDTWFLSPTTEPGEPLVAPGRGGTLWWEWTAPADGRLGIIPRVNLAGAYGLAVYTGESLDQLVVASTNAPFLFNARAGTTYQIQTYPNQNNAFEATGFNLEFYPFLPATNDNFADAAPFDGTPKSNLGATREPGEPPHASGGPNKSLWWKYTSGENRVGALVRPEFSTMGPVTIAVYQGGSVDTLRLVHKGINQASFGMWAGETFYIAVETAASVTGDIRLEFFPGQATTATRTVPGNLVQNGSFEDFFSPLWTSYQFGGTVNEIAPDGRNFGTTWIGWIRQNIATRAGERYLIRFVFAPAELNQDAFIVLFGGIEVGRARAGVGGWSAAEFMGTASGSTTALEIRGTGPSGPGGSIDHISVVTLAQPPVVVSEPVAATVFEGSPILFHAGLTGADPMARQWFLNDQPIPGQTDVTLRLAAARSGDAGLYHLRATNPYGQAQTARVRLTVEPAAPLQIVLQPQSEAAYAGQYLVLQSAAVGAPPISYQWFRNGSALEGETNRALIFASFAAEQQGSYTVRVSNAAENVTSLPAVVSLAAGAPSGGGLVFFSNAWGDYFNPVTVPVFDVGGETRLDGTNFVAQLYAGPTAESLRPVGPPCRFGLRNSGTWLGRTIALPNVPPNAQAFVQVKVWDASAASSYEAARALGAKFGRSAVLTVTTTAPMNPPQVFAGAPLDGLQSFSLMAGLPNFVTGNLALEERQEGGTFVWRLTGAAGFRYLIERQTDGASWRPFTVLENATGSATFTDAIDPAAQSQIYRARMLD